MREVWIIARHEYLTNVRRSAFIIMTLLVPALGILGLVIATFFGGQASRFLEGQIESESSQLPTGVVDHVGLFTPILPEYQDRFLSFDDDATGREALVSKQISGLLVIPADYMDSGRVRIITGDSGFQAAMIEDSDSVHRFFVDHLLQGQVPEPIQHRAADPITPVLVSLDQEGENEGQGGISSMLFSFMLPYFFGVLLVLTIFTSANYLLRGVAEEKTSLIIEIILSSVTARQLLAGKVLGLGALGLTQVVVWMGTFVGLSAGAVDMLGAVAPVLSRPEVLVLGVVYYLLGFLMYSVLMGATAALGSSMRESQQMAGMFTLTAMLPLMMGGFMMTNPNMSLARILSWFPLTAPTMMMLRLPMTEVPVIDVAGSILVILIFIPIVLWAGAKVFRLGLLMQGKRPTLFEIWRWLRET